MLSVNFNGTFTRNADSFSPKERMKWMLTLAAVEQWGRHTNTQSEWVIGGQGNTNVRQSWRDRQRDRGSLDYLSTSTWWMAPLQHSCQDFTERQNTQTSTMYNRQDKSRFEVSLSYLCPRHLWHYCVSASATIMCDNDGNNGETDATTSRK